MLSRREASLLSFDILSRDIDCTNFLVSCVIDPQCSWSSLSTCNQISIQNWIGITNLIVTVVCIICCIICFKNKTASISRLCFNVSELEWLVPDRVQSCISSNFGGLRFTFQMSIILELHERILFTPAILITTECSIFDN